jgi:hypothetical protein
MQRGKNEHSKNGAQYSPNKYTKNYFSYLLQELTLILQNIVQVNSRHYHNFSISYGSSYGVANRWWHLSAYKYHGNVHFSEAMG